MAEEQLREAVKRITEENKQPQEAQPPETPWSVPPTQEELPETNFEPLQPLEPADLGEAIAQSYGVPETFEPLVPPELGEGEDMRVPMHRPAVTPVGDMCPHGLAGMCIWCGLYPCDYMLKRALRFLLIKIEYGGGESAPT